MRYLLLLVVLIPVQALEAQSARTLYPETLGAQWTYTQTITLNDSTTQSLTRVDVVTGIADEGDVRLLTISSTTLGIQNVHLHLDSVKASVNAAIPLIGILPAQDFLSDLLSLQLPSGLLFTTSAPLNTVTGIDTLRQRVPTPQGLRDIVDQDAGLFSVTLEDSLDVILFRAFERLPLTDTLFAGDIRPDFIFDSILGAELLLAARSPLLGRLVFQLPVIDNYRLRSWYAEGAGVVGQHAAPYRFAPDERLIPGDASIPPLEIPGFTLVLDQFSPTPITSIIQSSTLPERFIVHPNYPNPFNPSTTIPFELSESARVHVTVYALNGQRLITLTDAYYQPGMHAVRFDAGSSLASGTYVYVVSIQSSEAAPVRFTRTMLLLK